MKAPALCQSFSPWLGMLGVLCASGAAARPADDLPTVAVVLRGAEKADKKLDRVVRNLSSLIEVFLSSEGDVQLVDRRTLDRALKELALVTGEDAERLGRLVHAKVLLVGTVNADADRYMIDVHLVEGLSGKILQHHRKRIATVELPRLAAELARLVRRAALGIGPPRVTVAVGNFDYEGIFDRLAPLQLRLKTLLVGQLLRHPRVIQFSHSGLGDRRRGSSSGNA